MPNYTGYEGSVREILGAGAYDDFLEACEKDEVKSWVKNQRLGTH